MMPSGPLRPIQELCFIMGTMSYISYIFYIIYSLYSLLDLYCLYYFHCILLSCQCLTGVNHELQLTVPVSSCVCNTLFSDYPLSLFLCDLIPLYLFYSIFYSIHILVHRPV